MKHFSAPMNSDMSIKAPKPDGFRFDAERKIIEHWDAIQEVPNETKNGNPMY